jgi:hypothetical protein
MGREAKGLAVWRGQSGAVKALLESDALILRGKIRATLPRSGLAGWRSDGEDLGLLVDGEPLVLTLGAKEALAWVRALEKPVPTLASKLGVSAAARPWVMGGPMPEELAAAVVPVALPGPDGAAMIIAVMNAQEDLGAALAAGRAHGLRVWCVHGKGKGAAVPDGAVRGHFRAAGWIDVKSSAVSAGFTATLYQQGKP